MDIALEIRIEPLKQVTNEAKLRKKIGKPCMLVPSEVYLLNGTEPIKDEKYLSLGIIGSEPYLKVTGSLWEKDYSGKTDSDGLLFNDSLYTLIKPHYEFFLFGATPYVANQRFRKSRLYTTKDSGINDMILRLFELHTAKFETLMASSNSAKY